MVFGVRFDIRTTIDVFGFSSPSSLETCWVLAFGSFLDVRLGNVFLFLSSFRAVLRLAKALFFPP